MKANWAEDNLQTIRTLMERSALYRRALAPVMTFAGIVGIASGIVGYLLKLDSNTAFVLFWMGAAASAMIGALVLVRRQALKDSEPFWSPPTRRVGQALLPAFTIGLMIGLFVVWLGKFSGAQSHDLQFLIVLLWVWLYGCGIHAAGFFMPRGIRWFGWIYIVIGGFLLVGLSVADARLTQISSHLLMGCLFGGLHLAYGIYLYFTEKKTPAS